MNFRRGLQDLSEKLNTLMERLLLLAGIAIAIILFIQVVARYLGSSLSWSEEVGRYLLIAITFLGATVAYKRAHFIGLKGFGEKLGPFFEQAIVRLLQLLTLACFSLITWFGALYTFNAWEQTSTAVQMPMSLPLAVIPISGVVFLLHVLSDMSQRER
jgi:TRAP-type C4-dicarboxylate transport system permease small subunit